MNMLTANFTILAWNHLMQNYFGQSQLTAFLPQYAHLMFDMAWFRDMNDAGIKDGCKHLTTTNSVCYGVTCREPCPVCWSTGCHLPHKHSVHGLRLLSFNVINMMVKTIYTWSWTRLKEKEKIGHNIKHAINKGRHVLVVWVLPVIKQVATWSATVVS